VSWRIALEPETRKELLGLPRTIRERIMRRIDALAEDPRPASAHRLTGALRGSLRMRVGDYRVSYEIDDQTHTIVVWTIGHRSRFYDHASRRRR
jgi:mRNA interferase RelE/StbE